MSNEISAQGLEPQTANDVVTAETSDKDKKIEMMRRYHAFFSSFSETLEKVEVVGVENYIATLEPETQKVLRAISKHYPAAPLDVCAALSVLSDDDYNYLSERNAPHANLPNIHDLRRPLSVLVLARDLVRTGKLN